jgi:hypothetical protein
MDEKIRIITLRSQFDKTDRETQLVPYERKSLLDLKNEYTLNCPELHFTVSVNGQIIPEESLALSIPQKGDCVVFTPKIEVAATAAVLIEIGVPMVLAYIASTVLWFAIMMGIGYIVNSLFNPQKDIGEKTGSQLYSWNPATTNQQGGVVPKMYGKTISYGNVISVYSESVKDSAYLNMLINVNLGPVKSISEIKINDQDTALFKNVTFETRHGYINQPIASNFNNTKVEYVMERLVKYGVPIEYTTMVGDFDRLEVDVSFLKGLYKLDDEANVQNQTVDFKVEAVNVADPSLVIVLSRSNNEQQVYFNDEDVVEDTHWSLGFWIRDIVSATGRTGLFSEWVEIDTGSNVYADHYEGELVFMKVYNGKLIIWSRWRWLQSGQAEEVITTFDDFCRCYEDSTDKVVKTFSSPVPKKGLYKIVVTRLTGDRDSVRQGDEMSLTCVRLVYCDDFSYPRHTLIGVKALASDQLSGSLGFSCILEGSLIRVYDGLVWTVEYNNNPAWVCYDILTQPVFYDPSYVCTVDVETIVWHRCILSHTSSAGNTPPNATYWRSAEGPDTYFRWTAEDPYSYETWQTGMEYHIDTITLLIGVYYLCTARHSSSDADKEPGVGANWENYWVNYYETLLFSANVFARHGDKVYRCILGHYWSASKEPGTAGGADYWLDCTWATGQAYKDITDAGIVRYDGIDPSRLDHAAFKIWADFCFAMVDDGAGGTEHRFEFNGGFDTEFTLWEAALRVCQMSRAMLYWNGNQISVVLDVASTPVQLFSDGNVIADSFEEVFMPYEERSGEIEISFSNKDIGYQRDTFTIFNTTLNKPTNKANIQLMGVTSASQAWRIGQFLLLCNQYLKRTITFKVSIDAIACTLGDVINFQHNVPQWGVGGRVVSATANSVTLDTEVTIEADHTYAIMIRLSSDVLVTKTVTNAPGTHSILAVSTPFTVTPIQFDVYSFGESTVVTTPFRVQSIDKAEDNVITLSCLEYDSNVYSVDTGEPVLPETDYSPTDPISPVTNLLLKEAVYFDKSGNVVRQINISFSKPSNPFYKEAIVYYMKNSGPMIQAGVTTDTKFIIGGCAPLDVFTVFICSRSWSGAVLSTNLWTVATITISVNSPEATTITDYTIAGLEISNQANNNVFIGRDCKFIWRPVSNIIYTDTGAGEEDQGAGTISPVTWFKDYEVQIYSVDGYLRRTEYTISPEYTYSFEKNSEDSFGGAPAYTFEIRVKARDLFSHTSTIAATLVVSNDIPAAVTNLSAFPVISGVCFTWDKNTEIDLDGYSVRTAIGLGEFNDWSMITNNSYTRNMTDEEIAVHGLTAVITIEVQAADVFGQGSTAETVSDTVAILNDNLFQFVATKSGGTGNVSDLYDGVRNSGGLLI